MYEKLGEPTVEAIAITRNERKRPCVDNPWAVKNELCDNRQLLQSIVASIVYKKTSMFPGIR